MLGNGDIRNLMKIISDDEFTYNYHSQDNSILKFLTKETNYSLSYYLVVNEIDIVGVNFNVPFSYSTKQIGIMFMNKDFEKMWVHCPLLLYEKFIIEKFGKAAYEFLDKCIEMGYKV